MQGIKRRLTYVFLYEAMAIVICGICFSILTGKPLLHTSAFSVTLSMVAAVWNFIYTAWFEKWESRQADRGRDLKRRAIHAAGFEIGLIFLLTPLIAWQFDVSLWRALAMDIGLSVFFLFYTFFFNWGFDRIFGLPASAIPAIQPD